MAWMIFTVLLFFEFLGLSVFHASGLINVLPGAAVAVLIVDQLLRRRFR